MSPADLLTHYGYAAVFAGGLLEGESILLLGAYAAHRGYLHMAPLIATAAVAAFIGDQFWFFLGRRTGRALLGRRPRWQARLGRANALIERHPALAILLMRFAWGLRTVLPLALGMGRVPALRYALLNALAAVLWASVVAIAGERATAWIHVLGVRLHPYEHGLIALAVGAALVVAALRLRR
ncbi:MAG: VTT domain-containing protein [Xenophilus sp.]